MDLGSLRSLVVDLNFDAHGLPITVTPPGAPAALETRGIWITPETDDFPGGLELKRREPSRVLAIRTNADPIPLRSIILAPLVSGGEILRWSVDGYDRIETEHKRYRVIPDPLEET